MAPTSTSVDMQELGEKIEKSSAFIEDIYKELSKVIVGQQYMIDRLLVGLLATDCSWGCWLMDTCCLKACPGWPRH